MRRALILAAALAAAAPAGARLAAQQAPAKEQAPVPGPLRKYDFPRVQQLTLKNGVKVYLVERHTLPIVTARIMTEAGAAYEPADKGGLAVLTGSLLDEGTRTLSGAQFSEQMEKLGAQFFTAAGYTQAAADLTSLTTVFPQALALGATAFTEPAFPEAEFTRVKSEFLAAYAQKRARAEGIGGDVFSMAVYDPSSAYARPAEGTQSTLSGLTRDDVVSWHRTMYSPANTTVLIVGDVTAADARRAVERALGGWKAPATRRPETSFAVQRPALTRVILVDRPGSVQSAIRVGSAAVSGADPDYIPMVAVQSVLGGGFGGRANMNLREKHGYTYNAFATLDARRGAGSMYVATSVRTSATDSAIAETVAEYKRIIAEPIPAEELTGALAPVIGGFPSSVQTVQGLRSRLQMLVERQLPLDYYATYRERLASVTPAAAQQAARKHLAQAVTIVVVGDLSKIEAPIRARNLGTVEVWDADGKKLR